MPAVTNMLCHLKAKWGFHIPSILVAWRWAKESYQSPAPWFHLGLQIGEIPQVLFLFENSPHQRLLQAVLSQSWSKGKAIPNCKTRRRASIALCTLGNVDAHTITKVPPWAFLTCSITCSSRTSSPLPGSSWATSLAFFPFKVCLVNSVLDSIDHSHVHGCHPPESCVWST